MISHRVLAIDAFFSHLSLFDNKVCSLLRVNQVSAELGDILLISMVVVGRGGSCLGIHYMERKDLVQQLYYT